MIKYTSNYVVIDENDVFTVFLECSGMFMLMNETLSVENFHESFYEIGSEDPFGEAMLS